MSDGMSDAADRAHERAAEFARQKYPFAVEVRTAKDVVPKGECFVAKEKWLTHVLTIYRNGKVIHRFEVPPCGPIKVATD